MLVAAVDGCVGHNLHHLISSTRYAIPAQTPHCGPHAHPQQPLQCGEENSWLRKTNRMKQKGNQKTKQMYRERANGGPRTI
mmetsp:Transcript_13233/g.28598  ORF Transcript_13233/g.28598 Transcript_13233/m.28598 type:complete len:81 (-) Transcript_13233:24-266(-)